MRNPLDKPYVIGDGFGPRKAPVPGASTFHEGQDWGVKVGTPIHAPLKGTVYQKGSGGAAGRFIVLQHDADTRTRYNHLVSVPEKARGETVAEGEVFAHTGGALDDPGRGASGGPHLHFGVYKRQPNGSYKAIDPNVWLQQGNASSVVKTKIITEGNDMDFRFKEVNTNGGVFYYNNAIDKIRLCSPEEVKLIRDAAKTFPTLPAFQIMEMGSSSFKRWTSKERYEG